MTILIPRFYPILDAEHLVGRADLSNVATDLRAAGVSLLQWRCKNGSPADTLTGASILREIFSKSTLIMNDRADLCVLARFDGVHVGQDDLPPATARQIIGKGIIGISTHTEDQVSEADLSAADYIAVGPIFSTSTKPDAAAVVGLEGIRRARARALTTKPLIAIGGITRQNARSVIDAGADSIAVISSLFAAGETVEKVARDFLDLLR